jgi:sec-independent protein translocase protein TatA
MFDLGPEKILIVLVIVLVLFGGTKIPELMRGLGEGMREFRKATRDDDSVQALSSPKSDS